MHYKLTPHLFSRRPGSATPRATEEREMVGSNLMPVFFGLIVVLAIVVIALVTRARKKRNKPSEE